MRYKPIILLALCLAAFTISVDVTIVNVALPTLVRQLGATTTDLQWVVDADGEGGQAERQEDDWAIAHT